jgi:phosphatidylserine decarboxylase
MIEIMITYILLLVEIVLVSTGLYVFVHRKTHISLSYLYKDNVVNIAVVCGAAYGLMQVLPVWAVAIGLLVVVGVSAVVLFVIRFYRKPFWRMGAKNAKANQVISSADGRVIYIKKIASEEVPVSVKNGRKATLTEIMQTGIMEYPCWLIGIEMTPFDVHRNGAPVDGRVVLNKHIDGEFRSLKDSEALAHNERNTMVFEMADGKKIGIVQTASRMVRRIVTYVEEGAAVKKGDWIGMIKFGSQVDMIVPESAKVCVEVGQQIYVQESIIAEL